MHTKKVGTRVDVVLTFSNIKQRDRAAMVLTSHGITTTNDPSTPILVFTHLNVTQASRIHTVLVTCGIEYDAHIKGMPYSPIQKLAHTHWDNVALPKGLNSSVNGVRIFGGTERGRPKYH